MHYNLGLGQGRIPHRMFLEMWSLVTIARKGTVRLGSLSRMGSGSKEFVL
jgi:hypothetical protein